MGDQLSAQPAALGASGAICTATGAELLGGAVKPTVGSPWQATAVAVTAAQLPISTATTALAGRSGTAGSHLGEAAAGFTGQDAHAATRIAAAAPTVLV